jgi:transcriptional regulator with XRE-family HTH domain
MGRRTGNVAADVLEEREEQVWTLRGQGWTQERIAKEVGIKRAAVGNMLQRLEQRSRERIPDMIAEEKIAQVRTLQYIVSEALQSWERSKSPKKKTETTKSKGIGKIRRTSAEETVVQTEEQFGDSRALAEARAALADIRQILGLNAPVKAEIGGFDGSPIQIESQMNVTVRRVDVDPALIAETYEIIEGASTLVHSRDDLEDSE